MKIGDLVNSTFKHLEFGNPVMDVQGKIGIWDREDFIQYVNSIPSKKGFRKGDGVKLYVLGISPDDVIKLGKTVMTKNLEFLISLKDNNTGEVKEIEWISKPYSDLSEDEHEEGTEFNWTDGNWACDCNRFIEFYNNRDEHHPCGHERFNLLSIQRKDTGVFLFRKSVPPNIHD